MIKEEEALRNCIKTGIITSQKQLDTLCLELGLEPYKVRPVKYCLLMNISEILRNFNIKIGAPDMFLKLQKIFQNTFKNLSLFIEYLAT